MNVKVKVQRLPNGTDLPLPAYQSEGAAGMDLYAAIADHSETVLEPGAHTLIGTGLSLEIPIGYEGQVRPRSGLALRHGVTVLNSPGTIDSDYRGEVGVILINHGPDPFEIRKGLRIAQLVFAPVIRVDLDETTPLSDSVRGVGGFGSTGFTEGNGSAKA